MSNFVCHELCENFVAEVTQADLPELIKLIKVVSFRDQANKHLIFLLKIIYALVKLIDTTHHLCLHSGPKLPIETLRKAGWAR